MSNEAKQDERELETISPTAEPKSWTLGPPDGENRTYIQKPLPYLRKMQFFALAASTIRQATAVGGEGALGDILGGQSLRDRGAQLTSTDMRDAESFVNLASSLLVFVPEFIEDAYCMWLNVPLNERAWAKEQMAKGKDEGGLSDEDGIQIIQTFMDQNWEAIKHFFGVLLPSVWTKAAEKTEKEEKEEILTEEASAGE